MFAALENVPLRGYLTVDAVEDRQLERLADVEFVAVEPYEYLSLEKTVEQDALDDPDPLRQSFRPDEIYQNCF